MGSDHPNSRIAVAVLGCAGRMGKLVCEAVLNDARTELAAITLAPGRSMMGADLSRILEGENIPLSDDPHAALAKAKVAIEFTTPDGAVAHVRAAAEMGTALISGTTGLDRIAEASFADAAHRIAVMRAANTSQGICWLTNMIARLASSLPPDCDVEILDMHHRHKRDAPSGTALLLGETIAQARDGRLDACQASAHRGVRQSGDIGFAALRGGDVIGDHHVIFAWAGERLELVHRVSDRSVFARGALDAAIWLADQPPGLYTLGDSFQTAEKHG